jgi:hypothetical protein
MVKYPYITHRRYLLNMENNSTKQNKYNVIIKDKDDNILTTEQLKEKIVDNEAYYINMSMIEKRITNR